MTTTQFTVPAGDTFPASLQFVDNFGNIGPAPVGIVPSWAVDNGAVLVITAASDGLTANIATTGVSGLANVTVTDVTTSLTLTGVLEVTVEAGAVSQLTVVPGTPVVTPPAA